MKFTGERLTTEINPNYGVIEHLHRYAIANEYVKNKIVLDIACGEGYGTNLLRQHAKYVYGVDISPDAINNAIIKYENSNSKFLVGSATSIPLDSKSIDVIVSFETIEHLENHNLMLSEIKRVLKSDGVLIISTPDKEIYSIRDPENLFHIKELNNAEFKNIIDSYFSNCVVLKQKFFVGSIIENKNQPLKIDSYFGDFRILTKDIGNKNKFFNNYFFNIAIASDEFINLPNNSLFDASEVYKQVITKETNKVKYDIKYQFENFVKFPFRFFKYILRSIKKYFG